MATKSRSEPRWPVFFVVRRELSESNVPVSDDFDEGNLRKQWQNIWKEVGASPPGPLLVLPVGCDFDAVVDD